MNKTIIIKKIKQEKKITTPKYLLEMEPQTALNKLYLGIDFEGATEAKKNIQKKISSYAAQDKKKKRYTIEKMVTIGEVIEKLVVSKMKCYYCNHHLLLFYSYIREPFQWTLDRIDNTKGHNTDNLRISCLKCNLERRTRDDKKFLFSKQMKIIKKN